MIAYVFWHRPEPGTLPREYEEKLNEFHAALSAHPTAGLLGSHAFHLQHVPWLDAEGYEDWYLLENTASLDPLEYESVQGSLATSHDRIARLARTGIAGLYKPVGNEATYRQATAALWFSKPSGMSYLSMFARLETNEAGVRDRLWQRMLTLGPTPEFCMLNGGPDFLPHGWDSTLIVRRPIRR